VKLISNRFRPPLRETGVTHFIHIPFIEACKETFENIIKTQIDPNDQDSLVAVETLHATIMVFRLRSYDDIPKWERILKSIKLRKAKVTLRGVGIFPIKVNTNYTRVLYIKVDGLDEIIHEIVSKSIIEGLVNEK
jgi:2'-5' RNA ligase